MADVGCGPGRVTAHLGALGLSVFGMDLSPEMVAEPLERAGLSVRARLLREPTRRGLSRGNTTGVPARPETAP
nr:methyltransferase domain-containing protein [Actinopolyspora mortivallis]